MSCYFIMACLSLWSSVVHVSAQIRVMAPLSLVENLQNRGVIDGATATFGAPFYGDRVLGRLVWGDSQHGHSHCKKEDYFVDVEGESVPGTELHGERVINIFMVRHGKCPITRKVQVAYEKGAHAVIVVDQEDSNLTAADMGQVILDDDGFGDQIHIPSVLVSKEEGAKLIAAVTQTDVLLELSWNVPVHKTVSMDLWMSSASSISRKFLKRFASRRHTLKKVVAFQPHFSLFSVPANSPEVYTELCTDSSGQFCAEDPDGSGSITGKEVIAENVRQLCIHEESKLFKMRLKGTSRPVYADKYWAYVGKHMQECPLQGKDARTRFGKECSERLMKKVGIDSDAIAHCVLTTRDQKLHRELQNTAWSADAVRINGWRYTGMLDADLVTRAICSGFIETPAECKTLIRERNPLVVYKGAYAETGVSATTLSLVLIMIFAGFLGIMLFYKRFLKQQLAGSIREEVMLEVQSQMSSYSQMKH